MNPINLPRETFVTPVMSLYTTPITFYGSIPYYTVGLVENP